MLKNVLLLLKNCKKKSPRAGGFAPQTSIAFGGRGLSPKTSNPPLRIPGYATAPIILLMLNIKLENCKYQHFKSFGPSQREKLSGCAR